MDFTCWIPCMPRSRLMRVRMRVLFPWVMNISRQYFSPMWRWTFSITTSSNSCRSSVSFMSTSLRWWSQVTMMVAATFSVWAVASSVSEIRLRRASRKASERL